MRSNIIAAATLLTIATYVPCRAQSAVDAVALTQWGASPNSKYYRVLKRTPSSVEYLWLSDSEPADLKVEEVSKCQFLIGYHNTKYGDTYTGSLDYTAAKWTGLLTTRMKMVDGSLGFQIIHVPGAHYCHTSGFSPEDYDVTAGSCREYAAFDLEADTASGINALKRFCPAAAPNAAKSLLFSLFRDGLMPFNFVETPGPQRGAVAALTLFVALSIPLSARSQTVAPKAKAIPGQWVFAPEGATSSKLAWQYTPGQSEFLAITISCKAAAKTIRVSVDLSVETQAKPAQRISAEITKGVEALVIAGKVETGESGPYVNAPANAALVAKLLSQPGEIIVALPHHRLSFNSKSLSGPYAAFAKACELEQAK